MRNLIAVFLLIFCCAFAQGQNNITKTAGVNYTSGVPTVVPSRVSGSEYAIDTTTGRFYQFHRIGASGGTWHLLGQGIEVWPTFGAPTNIPTRNISRFSINTGDSLYRRVGAVWKCINCFTGGGSSTANNGVSDNEDGGKIRLGNRYMGTPDAPFTMARKINVNGRLLHIGDLSDSSVFVVDGANDRIGIRTDAPAKDFSVNGEVRISDLTNGTPDRVVGANSSGDISRLFLSGMSVVSGVLTATDSSITNEIQRLDTFTIVSNVLRASLLNDAVPFSSVDLSPYLGTGTVTSVAATAPAAGLTITGSPITTAGTFIFALADDLAALEALSANGMMARTAANTYSLRTITAGTGAITITNGNGVSGNPTVNNTDPDQSITNELQTIANTSNATTHTATLSNSGGSIQFAEGAGTTLTTTGTGLDGVVTIAAVDVSSTNELQTIANTSNATSHTATLSNSGGSVQLVEGTGITLTTTGTGLDGVVTVAATATNTDLTFTGASSPVTLNSSNGTDVTFTAGGINTFSATGTNITITGTEVGLGTVTSVAATAPAAGFTVTGSPITASGTLVFALSDDLSALESMSGTGIVTRTAANTYAQRTITPGTGAITITNGDGVGGNPTINNTDPDQSTTNELQTIANTSNATSHTATLSNSGGSWQLVEGVGITITTTGTALDGIATIASTAGTNYQTLRDQNVDATVQPNANFLSTATINPTLTNDGANSETEVTLDVVANSIGNTQIRQGVARSLIGVTGNATANVADIQATAGDQVMVVNAGNTAISWATVNTPGITNNAVSDTKIRQGTALSVIGRALNSIGNVSDITGTTDLVLRVSAGNILGFGTVATAGIADAAITRAKLANSVALSVIGRSANSAGVPADIAGTADQVLRVSGASVLGFGTVATAGITNSAVTYAKIQNAVADNVLLGNNNGANTAYEEINPAAAQTMLGYVDAAPAGANQRIAYFSDGNTLASEAAFLYDAVNDRQTINCDLPGLGAGAAILNLANVGTDGTGEFLSMRGNISVNMLAGMVNSNTSATANTLWTISQNGDAAGDALIQLQISGAGGNTTSLGIDNSDGNKFKITTNGNTPGGNVNASFVGTNDAVPLWGINKDAPGRTFDVSGDSRAINFVNTDAPPTSSNLGTGLGTGGSVDVITGGNNAFTVSFTVGTAPVADGALFRVTFANQFTVTSHVVWGCQRDVDTLNECDKFLQTGTSPGFIDLKANGTLTASKNHILVFHVIGQ